MFGVQRAVVEPEILAAEVVLVVEVEVVVVVVAPLVMVVLALGELVVAQGPTVAQVEPEVLVVSRAAEAASEVLEVVVFEAVELLVALVTVMRVMEQQLLLPDQLEPVGWRPGSGVQSRQLQFLVCQIPAELYLYNWESWLPAT